MMPRSMRLLAVSHHHARKEIHFSRNRKNRIVIQFMDGEKVIEEYEVTEGQGQQILKFMEASQRLKFHPHVLTKERKKRIATTR